MKLNGEIPNFILTPETEPEKKFLAETSESQIVKIKKELVHDYPAENKLSAISAQEAELCIDRIIANCIDLNPSPEVQDIIIENMPNIILAYRTTREMISLLHPLKNEKSKS